MEFPRNFQDPTESKQGNAQRPDEPTVTELVANSMESNTVQLQKLRGRLIMVLENLQGPAPSQEESQSPVVDFVPAGTLGRIQQDINNQADLIRELDALVHRLERL